MSNQAFMSQFPVRANREFFEAYQGIKSAYQGNSRPDQGKGSLDRVFDMRAKAGSRRGPLRRRLRRQFEELHAASPSGPRALYPKFEYGTAGSRGGGSARAFRAALPSSRHIRSRFRTGLVEEFGPSPGVGKGSSCAGWYAGTSPEDYRLIFRVYGIDGVCVY